MNTLGSHLEPLKPRKGSCPVTQHQVPCPKSSKLVLRTTCLENPRQPVALSLSDSHASMTAAGGRRSDLEVSSSTTAWWHGISSASPCSTRPGRSGALDPVSGISHPIFGFSSTASFCSLVEGTCPRFRVEGFGETETSHPHACLFGDMSTRGTTYHDGTDAKEPPEASISRVAHPCTKGSFRKLAPPAEEKKKVPDKSPSIVIPVILPFTSKSAPRTSLHHQGKDVPHKISEEK